MATYSQFDQAAQRLLGERKFSDLQKSGYSRPDFCHEIARDAFTDSLLAGPAKQEDLELVRQVAVRLWTGDGVTGLEQDSN